MMIFSRCSCLFKTPSLLRRKCSSFWHNQRTRRFVLVTVAVYVLTFCLVMPFLCRDLPLTKYYALWRDQTETTIKAEDLNRVHAENAEKRLSSLPKESTKQMYEQSMNRENLKFVIAVQTIPRSGLGGPPPRYLTQVMVALHDVLQESGRLDDTALFICNAQRTLSKVHTEAVALSEYFPMIQTSRGSERNRYEREKEDYIFCLREAQKLSPEYVLLLEDDALPHRDFYSVLDYVLKHRIETRIHQGVLRSDQLEWAWLKLNIPTNLVKYEGNHFFALEWVTISLIGATAIVLTIGSFRQSICSGINADKRKETALSLFLVSFVYCMLLTLILGRPYINLPLTLSKAFYRLGPGTSCCTQALLFPQNQLPGIMNHLEIITLDRFTPLDFALDNYRLERNLRQFLICPNIFSHIGVTSALHGRSNPRVAENYLFIVNNLKTLLPEWFVRDN